MNYSHTNTLHGIVLAVPLATIEPLLAERIKKLLTRAHLDF